LGSGLGEQKEEEFLFWKYYYILRRILFTGRGMLACSWEHLVLLGIKFNRTDDDFMKFEWKWEF
jgi:hypothetical protein